MGSVFKVGQKVTVDGGPSRGDFEGHVIKTHNDLILPAGPSARLVDLLVGRPGVTVLVSCWEGQNYSDSDGAWASFEIMAHDSDCRLQQGGAS